jgi:hypothetical protein
MRKNGIVYGYGINDIGSVESIQREYKLWQGVLRRCYSRKDQENQRNKSYIDCSVSENFLKLSYFSKWCQEQVGFKNKDEHDRYWELDKDILIKGNRVYSEDTCVFVPREINKLLTGSIKPNRALPVGVHLQKDASLFVAQCSDSQNGQILLGYFKTVDEAFKAYKNFKENIIKSKVMKWESCLDPLVFTALLKYEVG